MEHVRALVHSVVLVRPIARVLWKYFEIIQNRMFIITTIKFIITKKCFKPTPTCDGGPDKICSDGYCHLATSNCPQNTTLVSAYACMCSTNCTRNSSSLQVISKR